MLASLEQTLSAFRKHPRGITFSALVFFILYWTRGFAEAIFGGAFVLAIFADVPSRLVLAWALVVIATIPAFYLADRPAQAERAGVLAFSLIALGVLINLVDTVRARRLLASR